MASIYYKVVELQRKIGSYLFGGSLSTPWKHLSKPVRIALIGLDGAGQVSLLNHIAASGPQPPDLVTRSPPMHMDMAVLKLPRVTIVTTDVGGGDKFRNQRKDLVKKEIDAVIFVIDGKDRDRWIESVEELGQYVLRATELAVTPLLMLANNASDEVRLLLAWECMLCRELIANLACSLH